MGLLICGQVRKDAEAAQAQIAQLSIEIGGMKQEVIQEQNNTNMANERTAQIQQVVGSRMLCGAE